MVVVAWFERDGKSWAHLVVGGVEWWWGRLGGCVGVMLRRMKSDEKVLLGMNEGWSQCKLFFKTMYPLG